MRPRPHPCWELVQQHELGHLLLGEVRGVLVGWGAGDERGLMGRGGARGATTQANPDEPEDASQRSQRKRRACF
jgi:hypothetical protein